MQQHLSGLGHPTRRTWFNPAPFIQLHRNVSSLAVNFTSQDFAAGALFGVGQPREVKLRRQNSEEACGSLSLLMSVKAKVEGHWNFYVAAHRLSHPDAFVPSL